MEEKLFTKARFYTLLIIVLGQIIGIILKPIIEPNLNIQQPMFKFIFDNLTVIIASTIAISIICTLTYWKIKDKKSIRQKEKEKEKQEILNEIRKTQLAAYYSYRKLTLIQKKLKEKYPNEQLTDNYFDISNERLLIDDLLKFKFESLTLMRTNTEQIRQDKK